jgi:hypothetical protein
MIKNNKDGGFIVYVVNLFFFPSSYWFISMQSLILIPQIHHSFVRNRPCTFIPMYHLGILMTTLFIYPVNNIFLSYL